MRLWIGLCLPRLPLEVFCPNWSDDPCGVVFEHERVMALSPRAFDAGVRAGMRRGGVLMLAPQAQLRERAPAREAQALDAAALALLRYTPLVSRAAGQGTLLIDIGASLRLFGGIRALCRLIRADLRTLGWSAMLACAPTARGAWLLARAGAGSALSMASLTRRLARLPLALLPPAQPYLAWFEGIGCATLADLARLPRPGLQRRCGRALLDLLDAAHGRGPELFEWIAAPATFRARLELFDRVEHADALLAGARRLLLQMMGWLCARQLAVERICLLLEHERGRVARAPTVLEIVLAEPAWREEHLARLLKERLARLTLEAPVIGLCLDVAQALPMAPPSATLFPAPGGSPSERQGLFELLVARLGEDNVLQAVPQADYRPQLANAWLPLRRGPAPSAAAGMPAAPRPVWLLAKPVALAMRQQRPFHGAPLTMVSAPERIEAGWWSQSQARDYFIAEGRDHLLYWVYRERAGGDAAPDAAPDTEPRWYLHGLFG